MARLALTMACWDYDRTWPLMQGRIKPEGIDLTFTCLRPEDTFRRQVEGREIQTKYPWVASSLFNAFEQAKQECYRDMHEADALKFTLPWLTDEAERTERLMGNDYWPYGLKANRHVVENLIQYSNEQGLASRRIPVDEIFAAID